MKTGGINREKYDVDEIQQRILNGDGGSWIKETYDPDAIFQLDRYHVYQEILRKINDRSAQREARNLFEEGKTEELLEFLLVYADSVETTDEKITGAEMHASYIDILITIKPDCYLIESRGKDTGTKRRNCIQNMGVQESQNCTVITMRMKHRRMRWSVKGASNMAKVLCCKENKELCRTIEKYTDGLIFNARMNEIMETLSAAKTSKKMGKEIDM